MLGIGGLGGPRFRLICIFSRSPNFREVPRFERFALHAKARDSSVAVCLEYDH